MKRPPLRAALAGATLSLTVALMVAAPGSAQPRTPASLQALSDRAEIENLMGRRAYYHAAGRNDLEFGLYAKRADISWGQNQGYMVGHDSIRRYYVEGNVAAQRADLARMRKLIPSIPDGDQSLGVGNFIMHALSTPVIEIAADGKTAKGMWYTPGAMVVWIDNKPVSKWMWEKYAVDFIREDGQWRFWHILVMTDFMVDTDGQIGANVDLSPNASAMVGSQGQAGPGGAVKFDIPVSPYRDWSPTTTPRLVPPPTPYKTFEETFSYGPPAKP